MNRFTGAGPAEILRSSQKDEFYLQDFRSETAALVQNIIGIQSWLKWRRLLEYSSDVLYHALTTLSGSQTLGEEYVNIVQVNSTLSQVPSFLSRALFVCLHTSCPLAIQLVLKSLQKKLEEVPSASLFLNNTSLHQHCLLSLRLLDKTIPLLQRAHAVSFYFFGDYFHIAKRISSIRYVLLRSWMYNDGFKNIYRILGLMSLLQLSISLALDCFVRENQIDANPFAVTSLASENLTSKEEHVGNRERCALCLSKRSRTTATPCGHLFCWNCIMEWMDNRKECPLCREKFPMSRLICLQNFE